MKTIQALRMAGSKLLLLVGVAGGVAALAAEGPAAPRGPATEPMVLDDFACTLVPLPLRAPFSERPVPPRFSNLNDTSINWSGYCVATRLGSPQKGAVTSVAGSWIIPQVSASGARHTYSACWVGIDSSTVEQIGTEQDWTPGGQVNYVWFEMYPHHAYSIVGFPITAGDRFGAAVTYLGNSTFLLGITNYTQNTAFIVPTRYTRMANAPRNCAEWMVEAPFSYNGLLPLANFHRVFFSRCIARVNGTLGPIDSSFWQAESISMQTATGLPKATPSALRDTGRGSAASSAFSVIWSHQ